jgi:hypothetical protein
MHGSGATPPERHACEDLRADLESVLGAPVELAVEDADRRDAGTVYLVGTPASSGWVAALVAQGGVTLSPTSPGPGGGVIRTLDRPGCGPLVLLAGSDAAGAQRAVYTYAREVLGVDPAKYFTGYAPQRRPDFTPPPFDQTLPPPRVPTLCYFDNDNDELANLSRPYLQFDRDTWRGVIATLVRLGYNAIDLHDHLGRSEFYRWDAYKALRPDYHTDLDLIDWVIDYAHARGVRAQIPMYLAWEFRQLTEEQAVCWTQHKQAWIDLWRHYLTETPLGKADLFLDRPRSQLWDCPYVSACGEDTATVMTEAFAALRDVVLEHNPAATLLCDLYSEGRDVWATGRFNPPKEYVMLWPNDGFGRLPGPPGDKRGYRWGCYMHAGFWLNHVVQDPYPERIADSMRTMLCEYGADAYCLVNGQTFRHFILNLEAYARACEEPETFDGREFSRQWSRRYLGEEAVAPAVQAMEQLHAASEEGYVRLMHNVVAALTACVEKQRVEDLAELRRRRQAAASRLEALRAALKTAEEAERCARDQAGFAHDQLVLPIRLFAETAELHLLLLETLLAWNENRPEAANERARDAAAVLCEHLETRARGDKNPKWAGWYDPRTRRPNGGFPDLAVLEGLCFF